MLSAVAFGIAQFWKKVLQGQTRDDGVIDSLIELLCNQKGCHGSHSAMFILGSHLLGTSADAEQALVNE
jgi:hypothetical protein